MPPKAEPPKLKRDRDGLSLRKQPIYSDEASLIPGTPEQPQATKSAKKPKKLQSGAVGWQKAEAGYVKAEVDRRRAALTALLGKRFCIRSGVVRMTATGVVGLVLDYFNAPDCDRDFLQPLLHPNLLRTFPPYVTGRKVVLADHQKPGGPRKRGKLFVHQRQMKGKGVHEGGPKPRYFVVPEDSDDAFGVRTIFAARGQVDAPNSVLLTGADVEFDIFWSTESKMHAVNVNLLGYVRPVVRTDWAEIEGDGQPDDDFAEQQQEEDKDDDDSERIADSKGDSKRSRSSGSSHDIDFSATAASSGSSGSSAGSSLSTAHKRYDSKAGRASGRSAGAAGAGVGVGTGAGAAAAGRGAGRGAPRVAQATSRGRGGSSRGGRGSARGARGGRGRG